MSREIRGRVLVMAPHPTLLGLATITVSVPKETMDAIRQDQPLTITIPEADPYARSADQ